MVVSHRATDQPTAEIQDKVRRMYAAWPAGDRETLDELIGDPFRFSSPYDDALDRATFFERCWPGHTGMVSITIRRLVALGDSAYVTYELRTKDDRRIENTELLRFVDGRLASVDVYFGAAHDARGRFIAMNR